MYIFDIVAYRLHFKNTYVQFFVQQRCYNKKKFGGIKMLVKTDFESIAHFVNHTEMIPYVGGEVLFVGECVHLPGKFFADKAEQFLNWYETYTPKTFEGLSEKDWRMAKVHFDVLQKVHRNYDKYAKPDSPQLLWGVAKFYNKIAKEIFARFINFDELYGDFVFDMGRMDVIHAVHFLKYDSNQDTRERFLNCSYCTYFQRPNLTTGEFQEIMPNEDKKSFDILLQILEVISPRLVIVLSKKASESIQKYCCDKFPYNIHFFNSPKVSDWTYAEREDFKNEVSKIFRERVEIHLQNWREVYWR